MDAAYPRLLIFVSTGSTNVQRRRSLRKSWFQYCRDVGSPLPAAARSCVEVVFVAARGDAALAKEAEEEGDIALVDAPEGYEHLWRKALVFLQQLVQQGRGGGPQAIQYVMHADDDSFIRLDLLMPYLVGCPRHRFYWGYIWDGSGNRVTAPIRNIHNKSHMPASQYPLDYYPPFASGCGFILSWDLVEALTRQPLPDYRLLDPPFGIHLCGPPSDGYLVLDAPVIPVHEDRVRPYRPIPMFHPHTLVQHYMRAEEMMPYYKQALAAAAPSSSMPTDAGPPAGDANSNVALQGPLQEQEHGQGSGQGTLHTSPPGTAGADAPPAVQGGNKAPTPGAPEHLYAMLVDMGLLRR